MLKQYQIKRGRKGSSPILFQDVFLELLLAFVDDVLGLAVAARDGTGLGQ